MSPGVKPTQLNPRQVSSQKEPNRQGENLKAGSEQQSRVNKNEWKKLHVSTYTAYESKVMYRIF
jgi:hypothetical protein